MLTRFRARFGTTRIILLFGGIYAVSQAIIGVILKDLDPIAFIRAQTTFSKAVLLALLHQWQDAGLMGNYHLHFYFDFLHPVWYAIFLSALMAGAMNLNDTPQRFNFLLALPFIAGLMDLVENIFHVMFISDFNGITQPMVFFSALAANVKWGLAGLSLILALAWYARYLFARKTEKA